MFTALYTLFGIVFALALLLIGLWHWRHPRWMGFGDKTLWDWMGILTIPAYLGFASLVLGLVQLQLGQLRAEEAAFQTYLDRVSAHDFSDPASHAILRAQTGAVLTQVTGPRAARVLQVLADLDALAIAAPDLEGHDLRGAELKGLRLSGLNFEKADLRGADLEGTDLHGSNFEEADLRGADLKGAVLTDTEFTGAKLHRATLDGALITGARLETARGLSERSLMRACQTVQTCRAGGERDDD